MTFKKFTTETNYCGKLLQMLANACFIGVRGYGIKQPTMFTAPTTKSVEVWLCSKFSQFTEEAGKQHNKIINIKVIDSSLNYAT